MDDNDDNDRDTDNDEATYKIGYKRPPLHTRFIPGRSANPDGRPKGRRNLKTDLQEELSEQISIREGDRDVRMTKQRALIKSTVTKAIKGDARAQAKAYELLLRAFGIDDEVVAENALSVNDEAILSRFLERSK